MTIGTRDQFKRAIRKARTLRGWERVRDIGSGRDTFAVVGSSADYTVIVDGRGEYACTCKAGRLGMPCWHQASVWLVGVQRAAFRPLAAGVAR